MITDEVQALRDTIVPIVRVKPKDISIDVKDNRVTWNAYSIRIIVPQRYSRTLLQKLALQILETFNLGDNVYLEFICEGDRLYALTSTHNTGMDELQEYFNFEDGR